LSKTITFKNEMWDVGSEATYLHLKAYRCVMPQSCGLKVFWRNYINYSCKVGLLKVLGRKSREAKISALTQPVYRARWL
jgi:hypothetical protein